ncbi:MAG: sigma-70 family RNA polymerase sigma factor [Lachnospiraceae bacterium]
MNDEHKIIQQVYEAKESMQAADQLIGAYMPFIKAETAKFLKRPPVEAEDDELSIAMIAFHEAIVGYSRSRGAFLKYASMLIRSRLIDYHRKEQRHRNIISLDVPAGESEVTLGDTLAEEKDRHEEMIVRNATKAEIEELSRQMEDFGISLTDIADNCPKQQRTLDACKKALQYARENPELLDGMLQTKRLPVAQLCEGSGVERKTLERHRKYMVALLLIYTNGYEIIRGHLKQVMKGVR